MMIPKLHPPETIGRISGWMGVAFLIGIALHSLWPNHAVSLVALTCVVIICIVFLSTHWKIPWIRVSAFCLLALMLGVWRFEIARPTMPPHLVPFSSNGLAFTTSYVRVADPHDPRHWLGLAHDWLTVRAYQQYSNDEAALLTGIIYGDQNFSKALKDVFRRAGMLHIVAVSGSNVTIVVVMVTQFLLLIRAPRRWVFGVITLALITFVLFVAPSASVMRAAIMGWLLELAPVVGRIPRPSRLLLIAAVVFTLWKPWSLVFDASFALSFLAMWGLLTWGTLFRERWQNTKLPTFFIEILSMTLGATIMTVPYSLWAFGQLTLWGVVTSLLALPLVPWIMSLGLLSLVIPWMPIQLAARGFLDVLLWIAHLPQLIPYGFWSHQVFPFWGMIVLYVIIHSVYRANRKKLSTVAL